LFLLSGFFININSRQIDDVLVVEMRGRLDSKSSGSAHDEMLRLIQGDTKHIIVNLEKLDFVSSAGLRVFLRASKLLSTSGGKLVVCCANELIDNLIRTAGFDSLLFLYNTEEAASQSL
jgi:anti-sigma B factor antagonist